MAVGTPYLIGSNSKASGSNVITITMTTNPMTNGDAIVVNGGATATGTPALPLSVTDTQNNVYTIYNSYTASGATYQAVALNATALSTTGNGGSADVITATYSATSTQAHEIGAIGCSGVASVNAFDQSGAGAGNSASPSVATPAQFQSGDLAVGVFVYSSAGSTPTWGGSWTVRATTATGSNPWITVATQVLGTAGAVTASATITSTNWTGCVLTLSPGQNFSGGFLSATVGLCGELATVNTQAGALSSTISFSASLNNTVSQVNTWTNKAIADYGLINVPLVNSSNVPNFTNGHGLVAFAVWNGASVNPVSNLADDGHNFWIHLGTTSVNGDCRCAVWVCPNAQNALNVSVGLTWFAQGVTVLVGEMAGFPTWVNIDGAAVTSFNNSASSLTLTGSAAAQGDLVFALLGNGNNATTITRAAGGNWNTFGTVSVNDPGGAGGPSDTGLRAVWTQVPAGGTPAVTWNSTNPVPLSGVLVQLSLSPTAPVQKNPNWPGLHVEAAFGYTPGDPTVMPTWTDITPRLIQESGQQAIQSQRGEQYESEGPEAGDITLNFNNSDGAFTPGNTSSPYYPNVLLNMPVRAWGAWQNKIYPIGAGYTERVPQTWPTDMPQYGMTPLVAPDALDPLSNSQLPSAYAGEVLMDSPYGYWDCGDIYIQNGAGGMPFANSSRTNTRPLTGVDGVNIRPDGNFIYSRLQTGLQWQQLTVGQSVNFVGGLQGSGLPGDPSTGAIGVNTNSGDTAIDYNGGAFYTAPDIPQPGTNGITVEFWGIITGLQSQSHYQELLRFTGPANNYYVGAGGGSTNAYARGARFLVRVNPGPAGTQGQDWTYVDFSDFEGNDFATGVQGKITDGAYHHFVFVITESSGGGSNYKLLFYLDGALKSTTFSSGVNVESDWNFAGIGGVTHNDGGTSWGANYTFGKLAIYPAPLSAARILTHWTAGNTGGSGDHSVTRMAKLFTYGGFGLQRASAPSSPTPLLGPADQIQGQAVTDAANTIAQADGGMFFADAANNITWYPRQFLFNRPVKWTLGDNPGETPYDPGSQYDFDNTFLTNSYAIQRQISSQGNGVSAVVADLTSEKQYFTRSGQQQTVETTSDQDAYDIANWSLSKYKQPALRVQQVILRPDANPSVWPVALGIEQGDIVRLTRRPLGGAVISQLCIVKMIQHAGGPDNWATTVNLVPYAIENAVLQCDVSGYNAVSSNGIAW